MKNTIIVCILVFMMQTPGIAIPPDSLVLYYPLNGATDNAEKYLDGSGKNRTVEQHAAMPAVADRFGNGIGAIRGGHGFLSILLPVDVVKSIATEDFTIGLWCKTSGESTSMSGRFDIAGIGDPYNNGLFLSMSSSRPMVFLGNHGYYQATETINDNRWHLLVATREKGAVALYVDGKSVVEGAFEKPLSPVSDTFVIGKHGIKNESYFQGDFDDVFLYQRAFTSGQVLELYRSMSGWAITLIYPTTTITPAGPTRIVWAANNQAVAYAVELDYSPLFNTPFFSVATEDTSVILNQPVVSGTCYIRIGINVDDVTPFYFGEPVAVSVK